VLAGALTIGATVGLAGCKEDASAAPAQPKVEQPANPDTETEQSDEQPVPANENMPQWDTNQDNSDETTGNKGGTLVPEEETEAYQEMKEAAYNKAREIVELGYAPNGIKKMWLLWESPTASAPIGYTYTFIDKDGNGAGGSGFADQYATYSNEEFNALHKTSLEVPEYLRAAQ
jgi:hypothetical protein